MRGLWNPDKRRQVRNLVEVYKLDMIILQETKLPRISSAVINNICPLENPGWSLLPSVGAKGGVLIF